MTKFEDLPATVQQHLISLAQETDITPIETATARVTENWLEKRRLYTEQTDALAMVSTPRFAADDRRGALLLTYSGSLIAIGPVESEGRRFEYASIKLRTDVPNLLASSAAGLVGDIEVEHSAEFTAAPVAKSSQLLHIATFAENVAASEQAERLRQAMIFLTNGFVQANQTLSMTDTAYPDQFTMRAMIKSVAARNDTTQALTKTIIDDFLGTVEAGVLLGKRVAIGGVGRVELTVKPARKARMGRNPSTGEEILIPSKPATTAPKMSFGGAFKDRSARVPPQRVRPEFAQEQTET